MSQSAPKREQCFVPGHDARLPYCSAIRFGNLVWTSGQLGVRSDGTIPDDFQEQVELALDNLAAALHSAGADLSTILKISAFVRDINQLEAFNEVYRRKVLVDGAPVRTTVQVAAFQDNILVEIDAVAHVKESRD